MFITRVCLWLGIYIISCTHLYLHCKGGLVCTASSAFRKNKGPVDAEAEMELYHLVLDESLLWTNAVHKICFCHIIQALIIIFFTFLFLFFPPNFHHGYVQSSSWWCWMWQKAKRKSGTHSHILSSLLTVWNEWSIQAVSHCHIWVFLNIDTVLSPNLRSFGTREKSWCDTGVLSSIAFMQHLLHILDHSVY